MPRTKTKPKPDRLTQAHERLTQAVESIVSGDDWQRMLKVASKFHNYSFNNQLLIFLQRPDATHVAGFGRWRSLGRTVKKGERGIQIFAPCRYKTKIEDDNGEEQSLQQVRGFRVVHVFDIAQTVGESLDDLDAVRPKLLDGAAPEGIWDALVTQANDAGFEVIRERKGSENGFCDFLGKKIAVRPDVSQAQALKTLVHELGHALLHSDNPPKTAAIAEIEVESVAYIVLDALDLASDVYSFPYVTRWASGDIELVKQSAERSIACAGRILKLVGTTASNGGVKPADVRKWLMVVSMATALVATGCSGNPGEDDHATCAESLQRERHKVGTRAVGEVGTAAGVIDGALDEASNRRLDPRDEQSLRAAQQRLERLERELDQAFNTGCM